MLYRHNVNKGVHTDVKKKEISHITILFCDYLSFYQWLVIKKSGYHMRKNRKNKIACELLLRSYGLINVNNSIVTFLLCKRQQLLY
jgi:hypothetical protein